CDHEPGPDAAVALVGRVFSGAGAGRQCRLEPMAARHGDAAQSTQLRSRRRAASARAHGRILGSLGAWSDDELARDAGICGCVLCLGRLDQSAAGERRSAMNRTGFFLSFAAFLISGGLFAVMAYRVVANLHDARAGAIGRGSQSAADPEYQRLPPDGQSDWMDGFTLTE